MKKRREVLSALISLALCVGMMPAVGGEALTVQAKDAEAALSETTEEMLSSGDYAENELLVTFKDSASKKAIKTAAESADTTCSEVTDLDEGQLALVKVDGDQSMGQAIEELQSDSRVLSVQPNYKYTVKDTDPYLKDPEASNYQYQLDQVKAKEAWALLDEDKVSQDPAMVAVVDTGVDVTHEDLQSNLVSNDSFIAVYTGKEMETTNDPGSHGTHVAGIIGATYGNGLGGSGVASGENNNLVKVLPVGASEDGDTLYTYSIVKGIHYAVEQGADVINMSFGSYYPDLLTNEIVEWGHDQGVVMVAAAGNGATSDESSPGDNGAVIDVIATNRNGQQTTYSDYGINKDISAPGDNITSTIPGDSYASYSGTSMATPVVASVAALVKDANPNLTPDQVRNILCATAQDVTTGDARVGFDDRTAYGIVDAEAAVKAALDASKETPAESITMQQTAVTLEIGNRKTLDTLVLPATSLEDIEWYSSNTNIATVENGRVTALAPGEVTIRAMVNGKTASCEVTVPDDTMAESIDIISTDDPDVANDAVIQIAKGHTIGLDAKVTPSDAHDKTAAFESSDTAVATVDDNGILVAREVGSAKITAKTVNGKTASFTVQVTKAVGNVTLTGAPTIMQVGDTCTMSAVVEDTDGGTYLADDSVEWSVSRSALASVEDGVLTAKEAGEVTVFAYAADTANDELPIYASAKITIAAKDYSGADYGLAKSKVGAKYLKIQWKKIPLAEKYQVQRRVKTNKKYSSWKTVSTLKGASTVSYTNKNLKKNTTYQYRVRALYTKDGQTKYCSWSKTITLKTKKN